MDTQHFLENLLNSCSSFTSQNRIIKNPFIPSPPSLNCAFFSSLTAELLGWLFKHLLILFPAPHSLIYSIIVPSLHLLFPRIFLFQATCDHHLTKSAFLFLFFLPLFSRYLSHFCLPPTYLVDYPFWDSSSS